MPLKHSAFPALAPIDPVTRRRTRCHRAYQTRKHELLRELTKHTDRRTQDETNESVDAPFGVYAQPIRRPNGRTKQMRYGRRAKTRYNVEQRDNSKGEQRRKMRSNERAERPTNVVRRTCPHVSRTSRRTQRMTRIKNNVFRNRRLSL